LIEQEISEYIYDLYKKKAITVDVDRWGLEMSTKIKIPGKWFRMVVHIRKYGFVLRPYGNSVTIQSNLAKKIWDDQIMIRDAKREREKQFRLKNVCRDLQLECKDADIV
jgi:hypothetical protein